MAHTTALLCVAQRTSRAATGTASRAAARNSVTHARRARPTGASCAMEALSSTRCVPHTITRNDVRKGRRDAVRRVRDGEHPVRLAVVRREGECVEHVNGPFQRCKDEMFLAAQTGRCVESDLVGRETEVRGICLRVTRDVLCV